jgi:hypothetical protein
MLTLQQADIAFIVVPVLGIVVALAAAILAKRSGGNPVAAALLYGGPLVLMGVLWRVYSALSGAMGADTVTNLVVNLLLFVGIGGAIGKLWAMRFSNDGKEAAVDGTAGSEV